MTTIYIILHFNCIILKMLRTIKSASKDVCAICLEKVSGQVTVFESCKHVFHQECHDEYQQHSPHAPCPNCRTAVGDKLPDTPCRMPTSTMGMPDEYVGNITAVTAVAVVAASAKLVTGTASVPASVTAFEQGITDSQVTCMETKMADDKSIITVIPTPQNNDISTPRNNVYVMDESGSMSLMYQQCRDMLINAIQIGDIITVIFFSNVTLIVVNNTLITRENITDIRMKIKYAEFMKSSTKLEPALLMTIDVINSNPGQNKPILFFNGDGAADEGFEPKAKTVQDLYSICTKVVVITIGRNVLSTQLLDLAKNLESMPDKVYLQADSPSNLRQIYEEYSKNISHTTIIITARVIDSSNAKQNEYDSTLTLQVEAGLPFTVEVNGLKQVYATNKNGLNRVDILEANPFTKSFHEKFAANKKTAMNIKAIDEMDIFAIEKKKMMEEIIISAEIHGSFVVELEHLKRCYLNTYTSSISWNAINHLRIAQEEMLSGRATTVSARTASRACSSLLFDSLAADAAVVTSSTIAMPSIDENTDETTAIATTAIATTAIATTAIATTAIVTTAIVDIDSIDGFEPCDP